jgi:hypothetical protein
VVTALSPIQARLAELNADPDIAHAILTEGADRARVRAAAKMDQVREAMGIGLG